MCIVYDIRDNEGCIGLKNRKEIINPIIPIMSIIMKKIGVSLGCLDRIAKLSVKTFDKRFIFNFVI